MYKRPIKVGPLSDRSLPHVWSWIYFHGKAEDLCQEYQHRLIESGELSDWEAPDLVRAEVPIEEVADGNFRRLEFVDGTTMCGVIWSGQAEYRREYFADGTEGPLQFFARRRGLICLLDDVESMDYAYECYSKRRDFL